LDRVGKVTVVTVADPYLDANTARDFKKQVSTLLDGSSRLVIDLGRVQFVDSSGCGALLTCLKQVNTVGGELKVCGVTKPVRKVFDVLCMDRILDTCETREDALRALGESTPALANH
jgi:anti-sigma B factor antagonist